MLWENFFLVWIICYSVKEGLKRRVQCQDHILRGCTIFWKQKKNVLKTANSEYDSKRMIIFPVGYYIPVIFSNLNPNCSNVLDLICWSKTPFWLSYSQFWPGLTSEATFEVSNCEQISVKETNTRKIQKMVFCYPSCSDLLWEKNVLVNEKNFWNSRLKAENLHKI